MPQNLPNPYELANMTSKPVQIRVDGWSVKGMLVSDDGVRIVVMGEDGKPVVIVKNKVSMYAEQVNPQPLQVLACSNPSIRCSGVRYISTEKNSDCGIFMNECPFKRDTCKKGSLGEWGTLPRKIVAEIIGGMILGDYPEKINEAIKTVPKKEGGK